MRLIKVTLLVFSLLQYITQPLFWRLDFYWYFLWVIAFQLLWFYIEKPHHKKTMLGMLSLFALINLIILPDLPLLMFALLAMEYRKELSRKITTIILITLFLLVSFIWTVIIGWPSLSSLFTFLGIITLSVWISEQELDIKERNEDRYKTVLIQRDLEEKTELLQAQLQSVEEVYTVNERNRISRDLHDSVGHTLSTIVIQTAALEKLTEKSAPEASKMLQELNQFTKKGLINVREVIHALKPSKYNRMAFFEQLNNLVKEFEYNHNFQIYFTHNTMRWLLNEEQEHLLFRAIQEFLVNTTKHTQATEVRIHHHFTDTSVILTMQDNGQGTDTINPQMGLTGMEERAKLLGGKVTIQSAKHAGFKVRIALPKGGYNDEGKTH